MIDKTELDLKTLEYIKFSFDLYSDMSSKTLGYSNLCATIEEIKQATKAETSKEKALNIGNVSIIYSDGKDYSSLKPNSEEFPGHEECVMCGDTNVTVIEAADVCHTCKHVYT